MMVGRLFRRIPGHLFYFGKNNKKDWRRFGLFERLQRVQKRAVENGSSKNDLRYCKRGWRIGEYSVKSGE